MDEQTVLAGLTELFRDVFDDPTLVITRETTADDIEDWDSVNHITIVVSAERKFGIKFATAEIEELRNVGDFVELILAKLQKARK